MLTRHADIDMLHDKPCGLYSTIHMYINSVQNMIRNITLQCFTFYYSVLVFKVYFNNLIVIKMCFGVKH